MHVRRPNPWPVAPVVSRGLPWSPVLFLLFLYCWLFVSRGFRGSRRLPWFPVVSRPVFSRIVFAVSLLLAPCLPWLPWLPSPPVVSRGLPPRGLPYCFCCFFIVGSWSPVAPVAPVVAPVVSRGPPFRLPWSAVVSRFASRGLPFRLPWLPWLPLPPVVSRFASRGLPFRLPWSPVARVGSRGLPNCKPEIFVIDGPFAVSV